MPYNYKVSEEADEDIYEAYIWYKRQKGGLGEEFLESLDKESLRDEIVIFTSKILSYEFTS
jgi:hypothetical protein